MDLREFPLTVEQRRCAFELLKAGYLRYQPFIIADAIEGGPGQTLSNRSLELALPEVADQSPYRGSGRRCRTIAAADNATNPEHAWSAYEISFFQAVGPDAGTGACVAPRL
jgi:hypothetical protein